MENNTINGISGDAAATVPSLTNLSSGEKSKRAETNMKSIHIDGDKFVIKEESPIRSYESFRLADSTVDLPGVFFMGTQYYDLKNVYFINNTGMANLIDLLKSLLEKDMDVQFVNVCDKIKNKIKSLGLDHIIICS
ncbi:MAG: hypothetical protein K0Q95_1038 [Bacteroidota bacterium]|jgi:hypothetical protein|nr:hypothetical protein [Bacteroidota bacterium]